MEQSILHEDLIDEYIEGRLHDKYVQTNDIENDVQEEIQECVVCFEPFDESVSKMRKYEFNHCAPVCIHRKCFIQWVSENRDSCIVCREQITDGPEYYNISLIMRLSSFIREQNNIQENIQIIHYRENELGTTLCKSKRIILAIFLSLALIATLPLYK